MFNRDHNKDTMNSSIKRRCSLFFSLTRMSPCTLLWHCHFVVQPLLVALVCGLRLHHSMEDLRISRFYLVPMTFQELFHRTRFVRILATAVEVLYVSATFCITIKPLSTLIDIFRLVSLFPQIIVINQRIN